MDVARRLERRTRRFTVALVLAALLGAGSAIAAGPEDERVTRAPATRWLHAVLFGWRELLPRRLRAEVPADVMARAALPFAAPVEANPLAAMELFGHGRSRWTAGVACDEEQRHFSTPTPLVRIAVALRF